MNTNMSKLLTVLIPVIFSVFLYYMDKNNWNMPNIFVPAVMFTVITVAAHFLSIGSGKTTLFILPLGWALCLIPSYFYSFHFSKAGLLGHSFTFIFIVCLFILLPFVTSVLLSVIQFIRL